MDNVASRIVGGSQYVPIIHFGKREAYSFQCEFRNNYFWKGTKQGYI